MFGQTVQKIRNRVWHQKLSLLQADPGLVKVLSPHNDEVWGLGFIEPISATLQQEHWLLHEGLQNDFVAKAAPLVELVTSDLDGWKVLVKLTTAVRTGYSYVKALSEVYRFGDEGWETAIRSPLPSPLDPLTGARRDPDVIANQTDSGGHQLTQAGRPVGFQNTYDLVFGPVTSEVPSPRRTAEYWLLTEEFLAAGTLLGPETRVKPDDELSLLTLPNYIEKMADYWRDGARFVITGCATYEGLPDDL